MTNILTCSVCFILATRVCLAAGPSAERKPVGSGGMAGGDGGGAQGAEPGWRQFGGS